MMILKMMLYFADFEDGSWILMILQMMLHFDEFEDETVF